MQINGKENTWTDSEVVLNFNDELNCRWKLQLYLTPVFEEERWFTTTRR